MSTLEITNETVITLKDLLRGDIGMAEVCKRAFGKDVFMIENKSYIWNEQCRLWKESDDPLVVKNAIGPTLEKIIDKLIADRASLLLTKINDDNDAVMSDDQPTKDSDVSKTKAGSKKKESCEMTLQKKLIKLRTDVRKKTSLNGVFERLKTNLKRADIKVNSDPDAIPLKNGMLIELRTLRLRQRTRDDFFTFECPVTYNPPPPTSSSQPLDVRFPNATLWMKTVFGDDIELIASLQKEAGYMLTGRHEGRVFWIWHGQGLNGKRTLCELFKLMLGNWYCGVSKDALIMSKGKTAAGQATPHLMALQHARIAVFSETEDGERLDSAQLKQIVGGDEIQARPLHKAPVQFVSHSKPVLQTNKKIPFDVNDKAILDRLIIWPFKYRFVKNPNPTKVEEKKQDKSFIDRLKTTYLDEVFSFFVEGAYRWYQQDGGGQITRTKWSEQALYEYVEDIDPFTKFVHSHVDITEDNKDEVTLNDCYLLYGQWAATEGIKPLTQVQFGRLMVKHLGRASVTRNSVRYYSRIKLKNGLNYPIPFPNPYPRF